jgi:hypothetical protein
MAMKYRATLASGVAAIAGGCMINPLYLPDQYSVTTLADGRFEVAISPDKYKEFGGTGNISFDTFVRSAVAKKGLCANGFKTSEPQFVRGYVSIVGECRVKS